MQFRLLGPLQVVDDDGRVVSVAAPKRRALLVALLLRPNRAVPVDELVDALWGDDPPPAAIASLHAHVSRLRSDIGRDVIVTAAPGYQACVAPGQLDLAEFERLAADGRAAARRGQWSTASQLLSDALGLWCGPALADVRDEPGVAARAAALEEARLQVLEERIEADLQLGLHGRLASELRDLTHGHPLRERLWQLRMLALYRSGRQADALDAYRDLRTHLLTELGLDPSHELQELEARVLRQDPSLSGPAGGPLQPAIRLPARSGGLIGRDAELEDIAGRLRGDVRMMTLVGPGGVGKTRLALAAAQRLVGEFPDGASFVDLSAVRDPTLVLSTIGQDIGGGDRPWDVILDRHLLLVLDNFEQVLDAAPGVGTLMDRCPRLRILVTSRAPLRIRSEVVSEVAPLPASDAAALFETRAREALQRWSADPGTIDDIVARLDGLPLAIELAAARVGALAPTTLRAELQRPLDVTSRGPRDAPVRHRALRNAISWSYALLSEEAQRTMRGLSVFAGGCDLQAAVAVADAGIEVVSELVDHSLMRRDGERYRMLDTIRSFAAEEADGQGETTEFRDRHLAHYIALMARVFQGGEEVDGRHAWLRTCQLERDNLRAALDHALAGGDGSLVEAITRPVGIYWLLAGAMREGERWTQARLDQIDPSRVGDRARAIMVLAEYPRWAGEHDRAIALRTEAIALARQSGDSEILATLLDDISWSLAANGRLEEAQAAVAEALELREREPDDAMGMAHTLSARADLYLREHRPQAALDLIPAIRACDERTPRQPIAIETDQLEAHALLDAGRRDEADGRLRYVLHASIQDDFRIGMLSALEGLARLAADEDPPRAAQLIGIADRVRAESGLGGYDPEAFTRLGADLRSRCGAEEFDAQRAAGHALSIAAIESAVLG